MTMNRYNQTEILEALNRLTESEEKILDSNLLDQVEDRVWLSISQSILNQQSSMPMPKNIQLTPNSQLNSNWSQWWQKKHRLVLVFLGSFVILTIIILSTYNVALRWSKQQVQPDLIQPIPLQELRGKAEAKFVKLSNGISFQDLQEGINEPTGKPTSITNQPNRSLINEKLQQEIKNKEDPNNLTVFFTEFEEKYFLPETVPFANFDISKTIIVKSWISGSYYKNVSYYDNKIKDLNLGTPEYLVFYLGGKYAIKGIYTQPYYLSGITLSSPKDAEIEFLKNLLNPSDPNTVVDQGLQTIDGKQLRVIETKHTTLPVVDQNETEIIFDGSTKYYFDQNDLSLHLVESYRNNQLEYQQKIIKNQVLEKQQANKIFHYQELSNLPIKEYKIHLNSPNDYSIADFVQKYDLYFIPELQVENISYYLNSTEDGKDLGYSYYDHYYDPDFNPYINQENLNLVEDLPSLPKNYLASYYQYPLEVSIYEEDKPKYEDMFPYYGKQARFEVKKENSVQIFLNKDKPITGKRVELRIELPNVPAEDQKPETVNFLVIEFKIGKYWYILSYDLENSTEGSSTSNFNVKNYLSQDQIRLSKLTLEQAKEIDQKNQQKYLQKDATTPPQSATNLD